MSDPTAWKARWQQGRIGFHRDDVHPDLRTYGDGWLGDTPRRVFVPLCGKTLDLSYLVARGHQVIGVELSELAVEAMCAEQGIVAKRTEEGAFAVFRAERLTIYCGDFFSLTADQVGADRVWDRAALVALPPATRARYAAHLRTLMTAEWVVLLNAFEYDQSVMDGPPFSVPVEEVHEHYAGCSVEQLARRDGIDESPRWREVGHQWWVGTTYLIRP